MGYCFIGINFSDLDEDPDIGRDLAWKIYDTAKNNVEFDKSPTDFIVLEDYHAYATDIPGECSYIELNEYNFIQTRVQESGVKVDKEQVDKLLKENELEKYKDLVTKHVKVFYV